MEEINSVLGAREEPTWEDLQKMTLVRNCTKETMRLHNPTGATWRVLDEDAVLCGYQIPAGVSILLCTLST